jgi:hypothetical protein
VLRAETSCSRAGAPQSQLQFLADWRELSVTAPVRSHSMFTVMALLAWNSLLRVGAYRSPNGLWMTAFGINQTLTSTGRMTFHGRFPPLTLGCVRPESAAMLRCSGMPGLDPLQSVG